MQKCHFAALLPLMVLLAAGVPALAADSIEELLHQDEVDGHNDALRRDLNALTEEQWQYYFKVERKQPDIELGGQLIVRESEERPHVLYIWVAAMVAGFGMAIGAIQASHYMSCRRLCRTIIATVDTSHIPPSPPVGVMASGGPLGWWRRRQKTASAGATHVVWSGLELRTIAAKPGDPAENWRLSNATSDGELWRPPS